MWERRQARGILSYFLRNQLYPAIKNKNGKQGFQVGAKLKIASQKQGKRRGIAPSLWSLA
jgi:hypothetical protein